MADFREFQKQYNSYLMHGIPYYNDYIQHHGILGMHWGIRRYQNPDGSLTAEGAKRYGSKENFERFQKVSRAASIATVLGGPIAGLIAGSISAKKHMKNSKVEQKTVNNETDNTSLYKKPSKKDIQRVKKIDLMKIRNSFRTDEIKDKWERALETDKFDDRFLNRIQEEWFEDPNHASSKEARNARMEAYADFCKELERSGKQ